MAVYTLLSHDDIRTFLAGYDLPGLKNAEGIKGGIENTNYLVQLDDGTRYILTLFEKRVQEGDLPFFTRLMGHLAAAGLPVPLPVQARNGEALQRLKERPALLVSFLEGKEAAYVTPRHLEALGHWTARLHMAGADSSLFRPNSMAFSTWKALAAAIESRADSISPGLARAVREELAFLETTWPVNLPQGVIHADLFPDNVFFDTQDRLCGIIDFYFACNDFLAYELAICLNAWCFGPDGDFNREAAAALFTAYHAVRPLSLQEMEALPVLCRGAALRFLLTRAYDWLHTPPNALVTPKNPAEYVAKLKFHQAVADYRHYITCSFC